MNFLLKRDIGPAANDSDPVWRILRDSSGGAIPKPEKGRYRLARRQENRDLGVTLCRIEYLIRSNRNMEIRRFQILHGRQIG
jgi:hypothetical protein